MSKFNPLPFLPSASTTMRLLLYPVHILVKVGIVLYDNQLPGRSRKARAEVRQSGVVCNIFSMFVAIGVDLPRMCPTLPHPSPLRV